MKLEALPQVLVCGRFSENLELAYYDGSHQGPALLGIPGWPCWASPLGSGLTVLTLDVEVDSSSARRGVSRLRAAVCSRVYEGGVVRGEDASGGIRVQSPVGGNGAIPLHAAIAHTSQGHRCAWLHHQLRATGLYHRDPLTW